MGLIDGLYLPRKISAVGCKIVGTQLKSRVSDWESNGGNLVPKVKLAVELVIAQTDKFTPLLQEELSMGIIDQGADNCIGGLEQLLSSFLKIYYAPHIKSLTPEQQQRADAALKLHTACFPDGLKFLNYRYRKQWVRLDEIKAILTQPEYQSLLEILGAKPDVERLLYWYEEYGAKLGITKPSQDPTSSEMILQLREEWHNSYKKLLTQTAANYDDDTNPEHQKIRQMLLSPYEEAVEQERIEERQQKASQKTEKETNPEPPPQPTPTTPKPA